MKKYHKIVQLFIKSVPETNKLSTQQMFQNANFNKRSEGQMQMLQRYMQTLHIHKQYLQFFQIGVFRDQKSKIQQVAKYVGLALRPIEPLFFSPTSQQIINKNNKQSSNK